MHDTTILIELAIAPYSLFHFDPIFYKLHVVFFKGVFREKMLASGVSLIFKVISRNVSCQFLMIFSEKSLDMYLQFFILKSLI